MDQTQDQMDPEVAQEVIGVLNRKIMNLRNENAELQVRLTPVLQKRLVQSQIVNRTLQSQLSGSSVKIENGSHASSSSTQRLLEEIDHWKSELERRPDPDEVGVLVTRQSPLQCVLGCSVRGEAQEKQTA
jgi:hypothetical protein